MLKFPTLAGFAAGLSFFGLTMITPPAANPARGEAAATEAVEFACPMAKTAVDRGHSLTRAETRRICSDRNP